MSEEQWREIALHQADELKRRAEANRVLIRERDKAKDDRAAALVLVGEYARLAGIDPGADDVGRWTDQWWEQIGRIDADRLRLDGQRWEALKVAHQLGDLVAGKRVTDLDTVGLAKAVASRLSAVLSAQGRPSKAPEMFSMPPLPISVPSLFDEVAS